MKIGIVATADSNPYATALLARLIQQSDRPTCMILAEESRARRLAAYIRVAGLRSTMSRIASEYRTSVLPDRDARFYLRQYAADHHLADWDSPLSIQAAKHDVTVVRVPGLHDGQVLRCVRDHQLDLLINTAGVIFKSELLKTSRLGMLNAHMARLPRFRGMNVLEWSLWFGERPAITIHFVTPGIDLGDILAFRDIPIARDDTVASLRAKSYPIMVEGVADCVAALREGRETRIPQQPGEGRQYFAMHPKLLAIVEARLARLKAAKVAGM
jgi:folate-dependent phosphoribosylglycinamide formyltransferase PurN